MLVILVLAGRLAELGDRAPSLVYVSAGGKCASTSCRRSPCQTNVWCSGRLNRFQESFCVRNRSTPRLAHDLRQLAVVAEDVGVPELAAAAAEALLEVALAVQELPQQRLAGGDVAVGLDPACRRPAPSRPLDERLDPRPELGMRSLIHAYCCACEQAKR